MPISLASRQPWCPPWGCRQGRYREAVASPAGMTAAEHRCRALCWTQERLLFQGVGEALGMGAMPAAAFLQRKGGPERGRQLATTVLKTSSMLLGGTQGKKNQALDKTKQPSHQQTALREDFGTVFNVLPGSKAWLPAEGKETHETHSIYGAPAAGPQPLFRVLPPAPWHPVLAAAPPARERQCWGSPCADGEAGTQGDQAGWGSRLTQQHCLCVT